MPLTNKELGEKIIESMVRHDLGFVIRDNGEPAFVSLSDPYIREEGGAKFFGHLEVHSPG